MLSTTVSISAAASAARASMAATRAVAIAATLSAVVVRLPADVETAGAEVVAPSLLLATAPMAGASARASAMAAANGRAAAALVADSGGLSVVAADALLPGSEVRCGWGVEEQASVGDGTALSRATS